MATLLNIDNISKSYANRVIFDQLTFAVSEKQKIGLIGRNGAGKSTLIRMILGEESQDDGIINLHGIARVGYIKQHEDQNFGISALKYLESETGQPDWKCSKVAAKFGVNSNYLKHLLSELSGGYRMRLKLAVMLLKEPNIFLLDEPTNYLDLHTQILLEKFLQTYNGAFIIVSHDREFLKRTCEQTLEIEHGKAKLYPGPINEYLEYKKNKLEYVEKYNKGIDRERKHLQDFVDRFRYKASKARQAQSKLKAIEKLERIEVESPLVSVHINIPGVEDKKGILLRSISLEIGYSDKRVASEINIDIERKEKVAIIGDNGQGKTTLLKTLASVILPRGGLMKWAPDTKIAYYGQHVPEELDLKEKVWGYLRRVAPVDINDEEVKKMAGNFLFNKDELLKDISMLSGGEKSRLCLAGLLLSKSNVLMFDEPTNHLDFETVEALGRALMNFVGTVIFISHNRTFVNSIATKVIEVNNGKVRSFSGGYSEYVLNLEKEVDKETEADQPKILDKPQSNALYRNIKKEIKKIEEEVLVLKKEYEKYSKKQIKNPQKFSSEDYKKMAEILTLINEKEEKWFALESSLEKN